jgi:hypothetical protein
MSLCTYPYKYLLSPYGRVFYFFLSFRVYGRDNVGSLLWPTAFGVESKQVVLPSGENEKGEVISKILIPCVGCSCARSADSQKKV